MSLAVKHSILAAISALLLFPAIAQSAPITFNTALPVASEEYLFREQFIVAQSGRDPATTDRDRTEVTAVSVLGYGVTGKLAVFGALPYRNIDFDLTAGNQRISRNNSGFGDATLFARYTLFQKDGLGSNFRFAPFVGIKLPTGDDDFRDSRGITPPPARIATGSTDVFAGIVATWQELNYQLDAQLSYRKNNEGNDFEAGNVARFDTSLQYRLWHSDFSKGIPDYLYGVLELNAIHKGKNSLAGTTNQNTGGTQVFITPGIQYVTKRWIAETAVQIPLSQNLNGSALETDYIFRASMRFNF